MYLPNVTILFRLSWFICTAIITVLWLQIILLGPLACIVSSLQDGTPALQILFFYYSFRFHVEGKNMLIHQMREPSTSVAIFQRHCQLPRA